MRKDSLLVAMVFGLWACQTSRSKDGNIALDASDGITCPEGARRSGATACIPDYAVRCRLSGLAFSPFAGTQSPEKGDVLSPLQIRERLELVADVTTRIRTYTSRGGQDATCALAREMGLGFDQGIWLGPDQAQNELELAAFYEIAKTCAVDVVIVGNEVLTRGDQTAASLTATIRAVRAALPKETLVTTAEVWSVWLDNPDLIDAVDVLFVHAYPFWEGSALSSAIATLDDHHRKVAEKAQGKRIVMAETGWPTAGDPIGEAVPSLDNATQYRREFVAWASQNRVGFHYFEAFDEAWKFNEGSVGTNWGVLYADGTPKPGFTELLRNAGTCGTGQGDGGQRGDAARNTDDANRDGGASLQQGLGRDGRDTAPDWRQSL